MHSLGQSLRYEPKKSEKNDHVGNNGMNGLSDVMTAHSTVETIEETTLRKATGSVQHATTITSHGEPSVTVVEKARMETSKPTSPHLETTTAPTAEESAHVKKTMDATTGNAHHVATTISHSERNATNVANQKQEAVAAKASLVEVSQIEGNEVVETLIDAEATEMDEIQIAGAVIETVDGTSVETVTNVVGDVIQVEDVQTVKGSARTNATEKPVENAPVMRTIEDLNPSDLADIRTKIETIEVRRRDSRSTLLGCFGGTRSG